LYKLPLVNIFQKPYEIWSYREATQGELNNTTDYGLIMHGVKEKLKYAIKNHYEAAEYILTVGADNGLEGFIDDFLSNSEDFKNMRRLMPQQISKSFKDYQQHYPKYDRNQLLLDIDNINRTLSEGQILFHGGLWFNDQLSQICTTEPLSTSFCPQVALRNAEWGGKAYDRGRIDLFVLRAKSPKTKVFVYRQKGTRMGNEKEVLFNSGATLILRKKYLIRDDFTVGKGFPTSSKKISVYLLEIDII